MGLETGDLFSSLNEAWPLYNDQRQEGDDHLRLIKHVLKYTFADTTSTLTIQNKTALNINAPISATYSGIASVIPANSRSVLTIAGDIDYLGGYNFNWNNYWDTVAAAWKTNVAGYGGYINFNVTSGTMYFGRSTASVAAGAVITPTGILTLDPSAGATLAGNMNITGSLTLGGTMDAGELSGTILAARLPATAFTTDTNQSILNTARKIVLSDTVVTQASSSNFMIQSNVNSGHAIMTFHSPSAFACNFGMNNAGAFYKGGWSFGTGTGYRFWDEQLIPLGAIGDMSGNVAAYKLFTGSALETRMSQYYSAAVNAAPGQVGGQGAGGLGTSAFCLRYVGTAQYLAGSTIAGSGLAYATAGAAVSGQPGGSWYCCGFVQSGATSSGAVTSWLRYA